MKIHMISDIHFQHKNIIRLANRPFCSMEEMEETIIKNWNDNIKAEDKVYFLGDFGYGSNDGLKAILSRLNGYKIIILGNHDKSANVMTAMGFDEAHIYLEIDIKGKKVLLSHYSYIDKELASLAAKRPNILKYQSSKDEVLDFSSKYTMEELIAASEGYHESKALLLKFAKFFNYHPMDTRTELGLKLEEVLKRAIKRFIGTMVINTGDVLAHGHSHSNVARNLNMINVCVEAHDYKPVSEDQIYQLILDWEDELYNKEFKITEDNFSDLKLRSDLENLYDILEKKLDKAKKDKEAEILIEKLKNRKKDISNYLWLLNVISSHQEHSAEYKLGNIQILSQDFLDYAYKNNLFVAKEKLEKASFYDGYCRNANQAYWTGTKFVYLRSKFGSDFLETINTVEDDDGYDLFIPHKKTIDIDQRLAQALKGSEYTNE